MVLKSIFNRSPFNKKGLIDYAKKNDKTIKVTLIVDINVDKKKETQLITGLVVYSCDENASPVPIPNKVKCGYYDVLTAIEGSKQKDPNHTTNNHQTGESVIQNMYKLIKPTLKEFDEADVKYLVSDYNLIKPGVNYYLQ